ncbi:MAG: hypothetical protein NTZ36_01340 [Candidatus Jorgensenbacteria bacterium]|nr:hypothetical protein [Candidatus Jorgensenbacteria bacterium]
MKADTKIFLNKTDKLDGVVDKIIHASTFAVVLVIPKDSILGHSLSNFNALKRESETAGKALMIESSDEHILELALRAKIIAENVPKVVVRPSMDIVRRSPHKPTKMESHSYAEHQGKGNDMVTRHSDEDVDVLVRKAPTFFKPISQSTRIDREEAVITETHQEHHTKRSARSKRRLIFVMTALSVVLFGLSWYAIFKLPNAKITLLINRKTVSADDIVRIGKNYKEVFDSTGAFLLPGEVFSETGNFTMSFPASGTESFETKATGKLLVYNTYSVSPQPLLKLTRFESPDGKIFRLDNAVTIPGAKSVNGKLTPSKVEVSVTADKAGDEYNKEPATHWTIPGFKGTARFTGIYADSQAVMSGGATGLRPKLSDDDRTKAEKQVSDALQSSLGMKILAMADKFKTFSSSTYFAITKKEEHVDKNDPNKFELFMEGDMKQIAFDEGTLKDAVVNRARSVETEKDNVDSVDVKYGEPKFDFDNGTITIQVKSSVVFSPNINIESVMNNIKGSSKSSAEMMILGLPRLESAKISFWPFWVNSVPPDVSRIDISIK